VGLITVQKARRYLCTPHVDELTVGDLTCRPNVGRWVVMGGPVSDGPIGLAWDTQLIIEKSRKVFARNCFSMVRTFDVHSPRRMAIRQLCFT